MPENLTAKKSEKGWVVTMPPEMSREIGVEEGSVVVLSVAEGKVKAEILPQTATFSDVTIKNESKENNLLVVEWLKKHRREYAGKFVALIGNRLVATGATFKEASIAARQTNENKALIVFVYAEDTHPFVEFTVTA